MRYLEQIDKLKERLNLKDTGKLLKLSVSLLKWVLDQIDKGNEIVSLTKDGEIETRLKI